MLLQRIERYLRYTRTPPARFGRDVVKDPNFVFDLREGREPRPKTVAKVGHYIDENEHSPEPDASRH